MGKNNYHLKNIKEGTKVESYSIKKFKVGAASVVIGASIFFGAGAVAQASESVSNNTATDKSLGIDNKLEVAPKVQAKPVAENTRESAAAAVASKLENSEKETLNKTALTKLIEEIDGKFTNGKYASKTEDSVKQLKAALEEARTVLNNAKTQAELSQAHAKLVTATTKLKTKPKDEKQPPADDTTNGKPTVGLQATNTEKSSDSNSIANSGARDKRHGKALNRSNLFRAGANTNTTNEDTAANQTYTAPAENANLKELADKLLGLGATVENNTKLANEMNALGDSKQVEKGTVKEINEFGGWKAVDGGVFAIARRTEEGVYPLETINSTLNDTVWLREQAFDRDTEYTLLLSKSRTRANRDEEVFDGSKYKGTGEGRGITKNVARYKGIEKTFTAYSTAEGSDVIVKFKPGYVGDSDGSKANYKVQVYSITGNQESLVYETTFDPSRNINDTKQIVTRATDGTNRETIRISNTPNSVPKEDDRLATRTNFIGKREAEKLMARPENLPNGKAGTFTSKPIALPQGADHYKVRISLADQNRTGMSYQAWDEKYSIPVTGADFSIAQDTSRVAKSLLQRVYDKLLATVDADKRGKTPESQKAYQDKLDAIKALLDGELKSTDDYKRLVQPTLEAHKELKVDKSALVTSKNDLGILVVADPTPGKTPETVKVYNDALNAAKAEVDKANTVIGNDSATVDQVAQAVADVKAAKAELKAAEAKLVVAATTEQKTKLQNDSDALTEAVKTGKTPKSIKAYEDKYRELEPLLTAAKAQAKAVLDKTENAGKVEATYAQIEVDRIKAELEKAAALLKDKGNTTELEKAKNDLKTLTQETNVTTGKTKETSDKYEAAKTAAEAAVTAAEAVIGDINSTTEDVANALAEIKVKKAELEAAKKNLVPAATDAQKAKLEKTVAKLVEASTEGKTQDSINAYNEKIRELTEELNQAKAAADKIKIDGVNATKLAALEAQEAVNAVLEKLEAAKEALVEKATDEQKTALEAAEAALTPIAENTLDGVKTPNSINEYKQALAAIQTDLTQAKAKAAELVEKAKANNATKADATVALAKVEELKAKLEAAKGLLKDKANTTELTNAKEALKALAATENVTAGKTKETADKYDAAKAQADQAVTDAETLIANPNATPEQVATALANVNTKKAALEKAKEALVDKITQDQKDDLANVEENLKLADTTGKTKDSIKAYNDEVAKLSDELAAAKQAAKDLVDKGDNAGELEAYRVQAKINKLKSKLAEAAKLLKDIDKSAAKKEVEDAAKKATDAIVANNDLTPEQKAAAKAKVAEEATKAIAAIDKATTEDAVTTATDAGKLGIEKEAAKAEIEAAKSAKEKAIEANAELTPEQKAAAKAKVAEEATKATDAIDKATTKDGVTTATDAGKLGIEKEAEKAEIEAAKAAKEKEIDARTDLTDDEKAKAKAKVAEEAKKAIEAIENAKTHNDASEKTETGKDDIKKINPIGGKEIAKKAIDEALAAKEKAIDARTDLLSKEKEAAKKAAREEAEAAKNAIDKATTSEDINKGLEDGKENIAKINPIGAKEEAKKAVEEALANKEKEIDESTNLTPEEKVKAKALAREEAKAANDAIDKATSIEAIEKALRPFLYQIDQDALVFDLPTFDFEEALKSLVQGTVSIELGSDISDQDVLSKLDLPEGLEVVKIEKPTTIILGATSAKVTVKLSDGSYATVEVPVEVVKKSIDNSKDSENNRRPENKVRVDKTTENTNREENRSSISKENSKVSKNMLPNTGTTETNTGLAGLGLGILGGLLAAARRRKEK